VIDTEEQLIERLARHGFDFWSTSAKIAQRFPVEKDWGHPSFPIIPFRLTSPLAGDVWKIPLTQAVDYDLPPLRYFHEFHPTPDAHSNHTQASSLFHTLFGPGERGTSTNVFERHWKIGFFALRVITWPRELNRAGHNEFEHRHPYLWTAAKIYIEPEFPFIGKTEDATHRLDVLIKEEDEVSIRCESRVYARRNLVPPATAVRVAGHNGQDFIVRTTDRTVRVPIAQIHSLRHTRYTPGRSSGSSRLELATTFLNRHEVPVPIAAGRGTYSLDWTAEYVSRALNKPLTTEEYADD
jgi:hypothetical protein